MAGFIWVGTTLQNLAELPAPDEWSWGEQDVSSSDAGRVQDETATMYKMLLTKKVKLSPVWKNRDAATVSRILMAFDSEYVYVRYLDAKQNAYVTREFYTGDKSVSMRTVTIAGAVYSSLTFNIIER